jgi:transcriptional regulator with XRE-family HTH domain
MNTWLEKNLFTLAKIKGLTKIENGVEGINQLAVETRTGVAQTTLSGILEQGKRPRLDTLEKLAAGLDVEAWQLLAPPGVFHASLTAKFAEIVALLARE